MFVVPESPRWLAKAGRLARCCRVLTRIGGAGLRRTGRWPRSARRWRRRRRPGRSPRVPRPADPRGPGPRRRAGGVPAMVRDQRDLQLRRGDLRLGRATPSRTVLFNIVITGARQPGLHVRGDRHRRPAGPAVPDARGLGGAGRDLHADRPQLRHRHPGDARACSWSSRRSPATPARWRRSPGSCSRRSSPTGSAARRCSLAVLALWVACFILTFTFPILNRAVGIRRGPSGSTRRSAPLGFVFILLRLPETKGKTLEEIEAQLEDRSASTLKGHVS